MKYCIAFKVSHTSWEFAENPTETDWLRYNFEGGIILYYIIRQIGNEVHKDWITRAGHKLVERIDYL